MNFWGNFGRYGCVGVGLVGGGWDFEGIGACS